MDILTNYYNAAGQIINRVPNLKSREFYRDYMCRHRFDEMFVASDKRDGVRCQSIFGNYLLNFGNLPSGDTPDYGVLGDELYVSGRDKRKCLQLSCNTGGSNINVSLDNIAIDMGCGLLVRAIYKSIDSDFIENNPNKTESITIDLANSNSYQYSLTMHIALGEYPFIQCASRSFNYLSMPYPNIPSYCVDGDWHIWDAKIYPDGNLNFYIDGTSLASGNVGSDFLENIALNTTGNLYFGYSHDGVSSSMLDSVAIKEI